MSKPVQFLPTRYAASKKRGRQFVDDINSGCDRLFMLRSSLTGERHKPLPEPDPLIMLRPITKRLPVADAVNAFCRSKVSLNCVV